MYFFPSEAVSAFSAHTELSSSPSYKMFYGHEYDFNSLEELEKAMVEYIEYYNKNRITTKLKGLSPLMYRQQSFNQLQY